MRLILLASALTASSALPDTVKEIIAQGMTDQWLVEKLAAAAPFGKHHLRARREAECIDKHGSCNQYVQHCTNSQFQETCPVTCNSCGTPDKSEEKSAVVAETDGAEEDDCKDTMQYCPTMVKYCDNEDYQGVKLYCRATCQSCDDPIELPKVIANSTNACEDKPWCTNFPYCKDSQQLRERISKDCPIECKELRCQKYWKDDSSEITTTAKNPPPLEACADQSQACAGISELCDQDNYVSTLKTYCQKTCNFCTEGPLPEPDGAATGECKNQYPNCEAMKFLCTEENNEYNERYRDLCPETCNLCGDSAGGPAVTPSAPTAAPTVCEDKAKNCNELANFCSQESTNEMMEAQCAKSCGFCTPDTPAGTTPAISRMTPPTMAPSSSCEDHPGHDCTKFLEYCDNYNTKVPEMCKKSCNLCDSGNESAATTKAATVTTVAAVATTAASTEEEECVIPDKDKSPTCKKYAKFCNHAKYKKKLSFQCPMTCKICKKPAAPVASSAPATAECKDKVPKQCVQLKRHCKSPKYQKVLKFKCPLTCGFCTTDGSAPTVAPTIATNEKFGNWSVNWSRCNPSCQQYKSRKCLQQPCNRSQLFKFQKCPAEEFPNIPKCQSSGAAAATPAKATCKNAAGRVFCEKHSAKCNSTKQREKTVMEKQCKLECKLCTQD